MTKTLFRIAIVIIGSMLVATAVYAQPLLGSTGSAAGDRWQSSWLDIKPSITFKKGETLRIKVEGEAENVLVRLLPENSDPTSPDGIEGDVRKVPANRTLVVTLTRDHPNVKQISVHAGREAFERSLGGNNGRTRVVSIDRGNQ